MNNSGLSTEARIHVARVERELNRRQPLGTAALCGKATTWERAAQMLFTRYERLGHASPVKLARFISAAADRLDAIPNADRGFVLGPRAKPGNRTASLSLLSMAPGLHPMIGLEHERGVTVCRSHLAVSRRRDMALAGFLTAHISQHALGRLIERSEDIRTVDDTILTIGWLGFTAMHVADKPEMLKAELNVAVCDVIFVGSFRLSRGPNGVVAHFLDVRTVLHRDQCSDEQLQQADALDSRLLEHTDVSVPVLPRRNDHVTQTLATMRGPKQ